jgi:hypothetical protein
MVVAVFLAEVAGVIVHLGGWGRMSVVRTA